MNEMFFWYSLKTFDIKAFIVIVPKVPRVPRNIYIHDERERSLAALAWIYIYTLFSSWYSVLLVPLAMKPWYIRVY